MYRKLWKLCLDNPQTPEAEYQVQVIATNSWGVSAAASSSSNFTLSPGVIVGQSTTTSSLTNFTNALKAPYGVAVLGGNLYISDRNQVDVYNPLPTANGTPATGVIGVSDLYGTQLPHRERSPSHF